MKTTKNDSLGDRMKTYENVTRTHLIPRSYVFLRIDGRAFHSYLKNSEKPFDQGVIDDMDSTAIYLCENIQNAKLGYVQSDEITVLLTSFDDLNTQQFFDGNIQKICSVVASMASAKFNRLRMLRGIRRLNNVADVYNESIMPKLAEFDCRCWNVPNQTEAMNTLIWRNQDCSRNSVSMVAQSLFSHKELQGKSTVEMQEMMYDKHGINWATYDQSKKNGRLIVKENYLVPVSLPKTDKQQCRDESSGIMSSPNTLYAPRTRWVSKPAWKFTEDKESLKQMIPNYETA